MKNFFLCLCSLVTLFLMQGCGSSGGSRNQGLSSSSVAVTVTPSSAAMDAGTSLNFKATVSGDSTSSGVSWAVTGGGTLSNQTTSSVTLTAPANPGTITLTATSKANTSKGTKVTVTVADKPQIGATPLPNGVSGQPYSAALSVSGGTAPFKWSVSAGNLPPGLNLNASTATITGTPTATGTYAFSLQTVDSSTPPQTATQPETIVINAPLAIAPVTAPTATVGNSFIFAISATGGATPYTWSIAAGSLPAGLTLNAVTGAISGVPTTAASASFTVKVSDSASPAQSATASGTITVANGLHVTGSSVPDAVSGSPYSAVLSVTSGVNPVTWSITSGTLPGGLSLNSATGTISGQPTTPGSSTFTLKVTDSSNPAQSGTSSSTLNVYAPLAISSTVPDAVANQPYNGELTATGGSAPFTWVITAGSLPQGLTLDSATGKITGTPTTGGTVSFTVQATDSAHPPQVKQQAINFRTNSPLSILTTTVPNLVTGLFYNTQLAAQGGAGPITWSLNAGTLPNGLSLDASTGILSGTVALGATSGSVTVQATDGSTPPRTATSVLALNVTTPGAKNNLFSGQYAMMFNGFDASGPVAMAGTIAADGITAITSGTLDINRTSGVSTNVAVTAGTFTINADNRGTLALTTTAGTQNFRVAIDASGNLVRFVEFDAAGPNVIRGAGFLKKQDLAAFSNAAIKPNFAFGLSGSTSTGARSAVIGNVALNGSGGIASGLVDSNAAGTVTTSQAVANTSTLNITGTGRGTVTLNAGSLSAIHGVVYVISADELIVLRTDAMNPTTPLLTGELLSQSGAPYSNASMPVSGISILHVQGQGTTPNTTSVAAGAVLTTAPGFTAGSFDSVDNGTVTSTLLAVGTTSIAATGRGTLTVAGNPFTIYMSRPGSGFLMDATAEVREGRLEQQVGLPQLDLASYQGSYVQGSLNNALANVTLQSGVVNLSALGAVNATVDLNAANDALTPDSPVSGLLSQSIDGRTVLGNNVLYAISPTRQIAIDVSAGNNNAQILELDQ
jgi:large repetitive protein